MRRAGASHSVAGFGEAHGQLLTNSTATVELSRRGESSRIKVSCRGGRGRLTCSHLAKLRRDPLEGVCRSGEVRSVPSSIFLGCDRFVSRVPTHARWHGGLNFRRCCLSEARAAWASVRECHPRQLAASNGKRVYCQWPNIPDHPAKPFVTRSLSLRLGPDGLAAERAPPSSAREFSFCLRPAIPVQNFMRLTTMVRHVCAETEGSAAGLGQRAGMSHDEVVIALADNARKLLRSRLPSVAFVARFS